MSESDWSSDSDEGEYFSSTFPSFLSSSVYETLNDAINNEDFFFTFLSNTLSITSSTTSTTSTTPDVYYVIRLINCLRTGSNQITNLTTASSYCHAKVPIPSDHDDLDCPLLKVGTGGSETFRFMLPLYFRPALPEDGYLHCVDDLIRMYVAKEGDIKGLNEEVEDDEGVEGGEGGEDNVEGLRKRLDKALNIIKEMALSGEKGLERQRQRQRQRCNSRRRERQQFTTTNFPPFALRFASLRFASLRFASLLLS
jgi:hypothetical protein